MSSMADMSGMSMDMSSSGMFTPENQKLARLFWYFVAGAAGVVGGTKVAFAVEAWTRFAVPFHSSTLSRPSSHEHCFADSACFV